MDIRIPPLRIKIMLASNILNSIMLVGKLAIRGGRGQDEHAVTPSLVRPIRVTKFSGKAPCREMRAFAGREKQPQCGALGAANQQPAS